MDTSKSDSEKIFEYIQSGSIKDLPADLMIVDKDDLKEYMDRVIVRTVSKLRHVTMWPISAQLLTMNDNGDELLRQRAIQIAESGTEPWTDVEYQEKWFLTRDSGWISVRATTHGLITSCTLSTTAGFIWNMTPGKEPVYTVRPLIMLLENLEAFASSQVKELKRRIDEAQVLFDELKPLGQRTRTLI